MDLHLLNASQSVIGNDMQVLHLPHGTVAIPHVQDIHIIQQPGQDLTPIVVEHAQAIRTKVVEDHGSMVVDHSQAIRNKLEKLSFQLHQLSSSEQFHRRFQLSSSWRVNDKTQDPFLYISVEPQQPLIPPPGYLSYVPTFHLLAVGVVEGNDADIILRLAAYNGTILEHLDERFSDIQDNLLNSKLLCNMIDNRFTMCYGLAKLPMRTQLLLLKKSNFLRERLDDRVVWRSIDCQYAIEKTVDGIVLNCCDQCSVFLEMFTPPEGQVKRGPPDGINASNDDLIHQILEEVGPKVKLNVEERLNKLKHRGITINQPRFDSTVDNNNDGFDDDDYIETLDDDDVPEKVTNNKSASLKVTVTVREGSQTKVVPLDKIRQIRQIENSKQTESLSSEKKKAVKGPQKKRKLASNDVALEDKKFKKESQKTKDDGDKGATEKPLSHIKKCPICQEPFTDVNLFMTHLSKCNVSSEDEAEEEAEEQNNANDVIAVDENGDIVMRSTPVKTKSKKKKKKRSFPLTALSCGICGQTFKFDTHYDPHIQAHEEKLKLDVEVTCPICSETLQTKRHLNPHFKKVHPNDGGCCVECLQVMEVGALKQHLIKMHQQSGAATSQKEVIKGEGHLCPDCGKKCQYLSELEIHMAIQHMGIAMEKPNSKEEDAMCHECGKVFNHRYRLKQHLSTTHNKSRDHSCPFCTKVFCLKHQLTKHLLTHSDVKPYKCKYCEYQNVRKYRVQKHCQKAHNLAGTDEDIDVMEGGSGPSEFVQNFLNISTGKSVLPKVEQQQQQQQIEILEATIQVQVPERQIYE